jgi:hypothetical protein
MKTTRRFNRASRSTQRRIEAILARDPLRRQPGPVMRKEACRGR